MVGAIEVNSAASADPDDKIAKAGMAGFEHEGDRGVGERAMAVTFFDHRQVAEAFAKGRPLINAENGENFKIHAGRREAPGTAEVHHNETDIFYVIGGSAALVTGGRVMEPKEVAAGEIRGQGIEGGEVHQLRKGDVIIVPAGTPHWFREVAAPFTYYTVKVLNKVLK